MRRVKSTPVNQQINKSTTLNLMQKFPNIADLRKNYALRSFSEADAHTSPFEQFQFWFQEAIEAQMTEPNAMTLATASTGGVPSARIVLLKGMEADGFIFYTNYDSRKGQELMENPRAALLFCWLELERQIRIEGTVERVPSSISLQYFQSRPKNSQIGAWASPQSQVIEDRSILEDNVVALQNKYEDATHLPLPPFWGGFKLFPTTFEFWQGRESRLHDRICYKKIAVGWEKKRLAP